MSGEEKIHLVWVVGVCIVLILCSYHPVEPEKRNVIEINMELKAETDSLVANVEVLKYKNQKISVEKKILKEKYKKEKDEVYNIDNDSALVCRIKRQLARIGHARFVIE